MIELRQPAASDYPLLALLHNATHEPHFHTTSQELAVRDDGQVEGASSRIVAEIGATVVGMASFSVQAFDRADRLWVDFAIHPDHRNDAVARALLDAVKQRARGSSIRSLWMPVREDYLDSLPNPLDLGFREVHRTFGGGFFLGDGRTFEACLPGALELESVATIAARSDGEQQLRDLYERVRHEKVLAEPTITPAQPELELDAALGDASLVAMSGDECVGMAVVERSSLGAWNSALIVRRDMRRQGIARALLAETLNRLRLQQIAFLNTAGVRSDMAYLGTLRSLGATIEPDWIAFEHHL